MNLTQHHIIISKLINRVTFEKNSLWKFVPLKWLRRDQNINILQKVNKEYFKQKLSIMLGDFSEFSNSFSNKNIKIDIITLADQTLKHKFDYLGSGLVTLDPIDWHLDFKSGFKWPKGKFYKKYITIDLTNNADVKVPWELSRCHHLLWLGEAYLITKDDKYAREIVDQIENWISENPLMYSINWTCAMDVAIRAVNWLYAVNMIISSDCIDDSFTKKMAQSLFEHGFYIYNNLEKTFPYSANHYASNITGLLFVGQFLHDTKQGKKWWRFALSEYLMEVRDQVLPSGAHFEHSTSYHRLMTELFVYPYIMMLRLGQKIPLDIHFRIKKMFEFIVYYTKPNGMSPIIGDNDDGRLLPFIRCDFRDHQYLLGIASLLFTDNIYNKYISKGDVDSFFLVNQVSKKDLLKSSDSIKKISSKLYADAGFAIMRSEDLYLFFNNSPISKFPELNKIVHGTHTHADALSFELSIGNDDFIIDPGSYLYTASLDKRNEFRSSRKHNTITIDNNDQLEIVEENPFCIKGYHETKEIKFGLNKKQQKLESEFDWNLSSGEKGIHKRTIEISCKKDFQVLDELIFLKPHVYTWYYHFAPNLSIEQYADNILLITAENKKLNIQFDCKEIFSAQIIDDNVSPSYGVIIPAKTLKIVISANNSFFFKTMFHYQ